jgi:hypothetical protein
VDGLAPGCDIGACGYGHMSDDIANPSNQVRETAGKFYALWRGQTIYMHDGKIRLFDTERGAYWFLAQCDSAGRIIE